MKKPKMSRMDKAVLKAMREAVKKLIEDGKKSGASLSIWKDGKVVVVPASKINVKKLGL